MRMDSKGPVRVIMPNGSFEFQDVTRIVIGKIVDPNKEFPQFYFRTLRIETVDGAIEILMESSNVAALQFRNDSTIFGTLKKQLGG